MILSDELRGWLTNRDAQGRLQAAQIAFSRDWDSGAIHRRIGEILQPARQHGAHETADRLVQLFQDDSWVDVLIANIVESMFRQPFFDPPFRALNSDVHKGLVTYEDEQASIALGVIAAGQLAAKKNGPRGRTSVGFTGQVSVLKFLKAGEAILSLWEAPPIGPDFTAGGAGKCRKVGRRRLEDGDTLTIDGRFQSFVIDHLRSNVVLVQATVKADHAPVSLEYDSATHEYVGCSAADDSASRIQMITTLLRKLDCEAAVPAMIDFLGNPNFFVRWHVMRELLALDAEAARPHLKRMAARDPHPETRGVARQVLDSIEAPRPPQRKAA
jgi:hypothetical protein